jgi:hypothetical protein
MLPTKNGCWGLPSPVTAPQRHVVDVAVAALQLAGRVIAVGEQAAHLGRPLTQADIDVDPRAFVDRPTDAATVIIDDRICVPGPGDADPITVDRRAAGDAGEAAVHVQLRLRRADQRIRRISR